MILLLHLHHAHLLPLVYARIRGVGQQAANRPAANPTGRSIPIANDRGAIQRAYRHAILKQTLKESIKRWLARHLHAHPQPFTWCYVEILLVDVAPIGRPSLITGNDARFCVTTFTILHLFQVMVHGILLCLVNSRYSHS